jgi:signal peptidase I
MIKLIRVWVVGVILITTILFQGFTQHTTIPLDITYTQNALVANTGSMKPTYSGGEVIRYTTTFTPEQITPGTIIIYEKEGTYIVHRVLADIHTKNTHTYITKGDNNALIDTPVSFAQIIGVVISPH